jgi:hypothetical protein
MVDEMPYIYRVLTLVVLMSVVAGYEYYRKGKSATRWREYGFVIGAGLLGAAFGLVNDVITSSISPEYFTLGKGIDGGAGLRLRAGVLGMKAGFSAGAITGAILLYAWTRKGKRFRLGAASNFRFVYKPVVGAVVCGVLIPVCFWSFDPLDFGGQLEGLLGARELRRFVIVWWTHAGLYAGLVAGLVWAVAGVGFGFWRRC